MAEPLRVWVDQDLCTGDGLCVQYAPDVFEFDVDGLAYVKGADGELRTVARAAVDVPGHLRLDVLDSARECPGECIHVERAADGTPVAGPAAAAGAAGADGVAAAAGAGADGIAAADRAGAADGAGAPDRAG